MSKVKDIILYYQKKIDRFKNDETIIVDSIHKLSKLPVTAELLQETGIYNVMNILSLRSGKVGEKALPIFNKWRLLVSIAMKDRESPIKSPDRVATEDKTKLTPGSYVSAFSKSSADSNASHCSRDTDSGKSSKYSDPNHYGRRESSLVEREQNHPSSSSDHNGLAGRDSYHLYEDGSFNPHLSIDNSDKQPNFSSNNNAADQNGSESHCPKNRILEPYSIEMREGMFRVVKIKSSKNDISPSILRTRQLYHKDFMKKNIPYKKERDKCESPIKTEPSSNSKSSETSSIKKTEGSPHSVKDRPVPSTHPTDREKLKRKMESSKTAPTERHPEKSKPKVSSEMKHSAVPSKTDERVSSPSISGAKHHIKKEDKKKHDRRSTPDSTTDRLKFKPSKEERSPSHKSKSSNPDAIQANCDRKTPKIMDSPDNASMKFISSKKERRSIYSGKKTVQDVPTLQECCVRVLKKHVDCLKGMTKVPYKALKPILEHLSPMQLYKVEEQNRYLLKSTDELWKQHCNRDYRGQVPGKNETWRIMYYKAHKEQDRKLKNLAASISASTSKIRPDRQTKITLVESTHDPQRKRMKRSESPIVPVNSSSPLVSPHVSSKSSPNVSSKSSPSLSSKSNSPNFGLKPETSKSLNKESKAPPPFHAKPVKKADAPLMSKLKKSMGLAYRSK